MASHRDAQLRGMVRVQMAVVLVFVVGVLMRQTAALEVVDLLAYEGQLATLVCPAEAAERVHVLDWYKQYVTSLDEHLYNGVAFCDRILVCYYPRRSDLHGRAVWDRETQGLTIFSTQISDEHMYVCEVNHALRGVVMLNVYVKPSELTLDAPSSSVLENDVMTFTCSTERVRPRPTGMYFIFMDDDSNHLGVRNTSEVAGEDGVFRDEVTLMYTARSMDVDRTLRCVLDLGPAGLVTQDYQLNITSNDVSLVGIAEEQTPIGLIVGVVVGLVTCLIIIASIVFVRHKCVNRSDIPGVVPQTDENRKQVSSADDTHIYDAVDFSKAKIGQNTADDADYYNNDALDFTVDESDYMQPVTGDGTDQPVYVNVEPDHNTYEPMNYKNA